MPRPTDPTRRDFVLQATGAAASLAGAAALWPMDRDRPRFPAHLREPFGALQQVADGVWALISTPLTGDRTTVSNGGLIAGRDAVLAVDGFNLPAGASWLAERSRELTGRWPTHVVLTHHHADHANGVAGYFAGGATPSVFCTAAARALVQERNQPADAARTAALAGATLVDPVVPATLDLGGRRVRLVPAGGHTPSDTWIDVPDVDVVFGGDLVWNGFLPNYVDTDPIRLRRAVSAIRRGTRTTFVPGHGAIGGPDAFDRYLGLLDEIERAARAAYARGLDAKGAASGYALPAPFTEWTVFNPVFFERAFGAWFRVLT